MGDRGDGPALVFVPGIDGTGELLLGTAARLEAAFRLVRIRYVDEGDRGSIETYERLADTLAESLEAAGVDTAVVLAEAFGGGVALHLALRHPERVRALAIVNSFCWYPRRFRLWLSAVTFPFVPKRLMLLGRRLFQDRIFFRPRRAAAAEAAFRAVPPAFMRPGFGARLDAVLLVSQWRPGPFVRGDAQCWPIEAPAGRVDPDETPDAAARRELQEETGVASGRLIPAGGWYPSPGSTAQFFHTFVAAADLSALMGRDRLGGLESEGEEIFSRVVPFAEAMDWVDTGRIDCGPALTLLLWLARRRDALRAEWG